MVRTRLDQIAGVKWLINNTAIRARAPGAHHCLIRAAAKNFKDVLVLSNKNQYKDFINHLEKNGPCSEINLRKSYASEAFNISSHYDTMIFKYLNEEHNIVFKESKKDYKELRYGENPHQKGFYFGNLKDMFDQLNGKELSYNNLLDIDAAVNLISEFKETTFAILKHNNACGIASRENLKNSYLDALEADPVSAFGGILITNQEINLETAEEINKLFYEVLIAPGFSEDALSLLKTKAKRVLLKQKNIKARKSYILLLWIIPFSVIYFLVSNDFFYIKLTIFSIPLSAAISNYFYHHKKTNWLNFLILSLLVVIISNHLLG